jgi:hypothetical protein
VLSHGLVKEREVPSRDIEEAVRRERVIEHCIDSPKHALAQPLAPSSRSHPPTDTGIFDPSRCCFTVDTFRAEPPTFRGIAEQVTQA